MTTLHCRCGIEVGIVRLNADTLALGHRVNPRNNRHAVRLARSVDVLGAPRLSEGPNDLGAMDPGNGNHGAASSETPQARLPSPGGPSHRPALARASIGAQPSRLVPETSMPVGSRQSGQGVASLIPPAIRPAPTAGD
jgi:hypothetical protein